MNYVTSLFLAFGAYTHSNPVLAGVMSLWGLSFVTIIFRKIPAKIFAWVYGQITTTLELDNTELGWGRENYAGFMAWYMSRKQVNFTRHFSVLVHGQQVEQLLEKTGKTASVGVGTGTHYFIYKKRLCKMTRRMVEKQGRENNIFQIIITVFSRNKQLVYDIVDEFCYKHDMTKKRLYSFGNSGRYWSSDGTIRTRGLNTVMASKGLKHFIVKEIEDFLLDRQWYYDRGLPYKKTFVIHGRPGGGKTSLIKAIASHFGMHIARLNLSTMTDGMLESALANTPDHSIVLMEDFDSADAVKSRHAKQAALKLKKKDDDEDEEKENAGKKTISLFSSSDGLTLSGVLNALDGVVELDGTIIFMTTNVLHDIDEAVIRAGRVDHIIEVPALTHDEIVEYIELMFPNVITGDFKIRFDDIMGCDLQAIYFEHPDSVYDFIGAIPGQSTEQLLQPKTKMELQAA